MNIDRTLDHIDALRDMLAYKQETLLKHCLKEFWDKYGLTINAIFWNILVPEDPFDANDPSVPLVYDIRLGAGDPIPQEGEGHCVSSLLDRLGSTIALPQTVNAVDFSIPVSVLERGVSSFIFYQASCEDSQEFVKVNLGQAKSIYEVDTDELEQDAADLNSIFQACSEYLVATCGVNVVCMATPLEITWRTV